MSLGFILRCARQRAGLSLTEVADAIGSHAGSISNYENDVSTPRIVTAARLSELYNMPWDQMRDAALGKG